MPDEVWRTEGDYEFSALKQSEVSLACFAVFLANGSSATIRHAYTERSGDGNTCPTITLPLPTGCNVSHHTNTPPR